MKSMNIIWGSAKFPQQAVLSWEVGLGASLFPGRLVAGMLGSTRLCSSVDMAAEREERQPCTEKTLSVGAVLLQCDIGERTPDCIRSPVFESQICIRLCDQRKTI